MNFSNRLSFLQVIDEIGATHENSTMLNDRFTKIHGAEIIEVGGAGGHYPLPLTHKSRRHR